MRHKIIAELILNWAVTIFGKVAKNPKERAMRVFEEAAELAQGTDVSYHECNQILIRTFNRPKNEGHLEVGGLLVTVYAYCATQKIDPMFALESEVERVLAKDSSHWKKKFDDKVADGTALKE